jgi:hypothetical protein
VQQSFKIIFFTLALFSNIIRTVSSEQAYFDLERSKTLRPMSLIIHISDEQKESFVASAKEFYKSGLELKNEKTYDLAASEFKRSIKIYLCLLNQYPSKSIEYLTYKKLIKASYKLGLGCYNHCLRNVNNEDLKIWLFNKRLKFLLLFK